MSRSKTHPRRSPSLRLENLEDRVVPAVEFDPAELWVRDSLALVPFPKTLAA